MHVPHSLQLLQLDKLERFSVKLVKQEYYWSEHLSFHVLFQGSFSSNSAVLSPFSVKFSWPGFCPKGKFLFELMQFTYLASEKSKENHFYHYEKIFVTFPSSKKKKKNQAESWNLA